MPQLENGFTRIANELIDAIAAIRIPGEAMQVFWVIMRKTYGFQKKTDSIALAQFSTATGLNKQAVCRAVKKLEQMNMVIIKKDNVIEKDKRHASEYAINKDIENWRPLSKKITLSKKIINVIEKDNLPLSKKIPSKETISKEKRNPAKKSQEPKINAWAIWVDINREYDRADPVAVSPDLSAGKNIAKAIGNEDKIADIMRCYLEDKETFLVNNGHSLRMLSGRINKYVNQSPQVELPGPDMETLMKIEAMAIAEEARKAAK